MNQKNEVLQKNNDLPIKNLSQEELEKVDGGQYLSIENPDPDKLSIHKLRPEDRPFGIKPKKTDP